MRAHVIGPLTAVTALLFGCDHPDPAQLFQNSPVPSLSSNGYLGAGDLLVSEASSGSIRRISADGSSSSIFHTGIAGPRGITVEANGDVVVVEFAGNLRRIESDGSSSSVFITGLTNPSGVAVLPAGGLIVTEDHAAGRLWRIAPDGSSATVLASGIKSEAAEVAENGDIFVVQELAGGQLLKVTLGPPVVVSVLFSGLSAPSDLAIETPGGFVVAEFGSNAVRRISSDGSASSVVMGGLASLEGIEVALNGDLLVSQLSLGQLTRITPDGSSSSLFFSGLNGPDQFVVVDATFVGIDIKPGSDPNSIQLRGRGTLPVAILATEDFDATAVDPTTVTIGNGYGNDTPVASVGNGRLMASVEDTDGDGDSDLVVHFDIQSLVASGDLISTTTMLIREGMTIDGEPISGSDNIRIVGSGV